MRGGERRRGVHNGVVIYVYTIGLMLGVCAHHVYIFYYAIRFVGVFPRSDKPTSAVFCVMEHPGPGGPPTVVSDTHRRKSSQIG